MHRLNLEQNTILGFSQKNVTHHTIGTHLMEMLVGKGQCLFRRNLRSLGAHEMSISPDDLYIVPRFWNEESELVLMADIN